MGGRCAAPRRAGGITLDTLTHALSGALLARATAPGHPGPEQLTVRGRLALGFIAAAFPDSDFILRGFDTLTYLNLHRGVTHSILMLPLWAGLLAWLVRALSRDKRPWRAYIGVIALGLGIHIAGDVITAYGTKVFAPVSDMRVSWPTTFIIDPIFTGIIFAGLLLGRARAWGGRFALAGLVALGGYVGFQAVLHQRAVQLGDRYIAAMDLVGARSYAMPQPLSPYNWKVTVIDGDTYHEARVNLRRKEQFRLAADAGWFARVYASYPPVRDMVWARYTRFGDSVDDIRLAREAWRHEAFAPFRRFAMYPVLAGLERGDRRVCAWFADLRFTLVGRVPPFRFGMCRARPAGRWQLSRMR